MTSLFDWNIEYDGAAPPLPRALQTPELFLAEGSYFVWIDPIIAGSRDEISPRKLAGILRVKHHNAENSCKFSASGDLYLRPSEEVERTKEIVRNQKEDDVKDKLVALQFPIASYTYYLRSTDFESSDTNKSFDLKLDTHKWGGREIGWENGPELTIPFALGRGDQSQYESHAVRNDSGTEVARINLMHIGESVRHATIDIYDTATASADQARLRWDENTWKSSLGDTGWLIDFGRIETSSREAEDLQRQFPALEDGGWSRHQLLRFYNDVVAPLLGSETDHWRYVFLVVENIVHGDEARPSGLLFSLGTREGAAIATVRTADWLGGGTLEESDQKWFDRVALHEFGHMQGLYHNHLGGIMDSHGDAQTRTETRRGGSFAVPEDRFLRHSELDAFRLYHLPDMWVRPRGTPFGYRYRDTAVSPLELVPKNANGLRFSMAIHVDPAQRQPKLTDLQVKFELSNESPTDVICPNQLHIQPRYQRLGIKIQTPSGDTIEVLPVRFPRPLGPLANTSLLKREKLELEIDWQRNDSTVERAREFTFNQNGTYSIAAHLMWKNNGFESNDSAVYFHLEDTQEVKI